jgi:hypothetical protein
VTGKSGQRILNHCCTYVEGIFDSSDGCIGSDDNDEKLEGSPSLFPSMAVTSTRRSSDHSLQIPSPVGVLRGS